MSDTSDRYSSLHQLTPAQTLALDALDGGQTHGEAAQAAGVDRTTVSRWATKHPAFIAELNRRKVERAERNERRLHELTLMAIETVAGAIEGRDVAVALQWLKLRGLPTLPILGPTSPAAVIEHQRIRLPAGLNRLLDEMDHGATTEEAMNAIIRELEDKGEPS